MNKSFGWSFIQSSWIFSIDLETGKRQCPFLKAVHFISCGPFNTSLPFPLFITNAATSLKLHVPPPQLQSGFNCIIVLICFRAGLWLPNIRDFNNRYCLLSSAFVPWSYDHYLSSRKRIAGGSQQDKFPSLSHAFKMLTAYALPCNSSLKGVSYRHFLGCSALTPYVMNLFLFNLL